MTGRQAAATAALFIATTRASSTGQALAGQGLPFVRDANEPFVYLKFDHIGTGVRRSDDEPSFRIWFHFVNNCNVSIRLRAYGVPDGSAAHEVGVMDNVVPDPPVLTIVSSDDSQVAEKYDSAIRGKPVDIGKGHGQEGQMPSGYVSEVSGAISVSPGEAVLFSVPTNHVGSKVGHWHMEIPFWFATPTGHGLRDPFTGGEPVMALSYSLYDLPDKARTAITK